MIKEFLITLVGEYTLQTVNVLENGSFPPLGLASMDVPWIASAILFIVTLYCVFRLVGGLLGK